MQGTQIILICAQHRPVETRQPVTHIGGSACVLRGLGQQDSWGPAGISWMSSRPRLVPLRLTVPERLTMTAPRTTSRDIVRHKASNSQQ
jgi:hypothetical protein